jgi:AMMECR1 domain-containing protein
MAQPGALANLDHNACIERLSNGTMLKQIAAEYGVSKVAVYKQLRKHPDYPDAISAQAHAFVEDAMTEVMNCTADTVNIARARVDAAFKYAKAHNPDYADKQGAGDLHITVMVARDGHAVRVRRVGATLGATVPSIEDDSQSNQ